MLMVDFPSGISVVVPVYNSQETLAELAAQVEGVLRSRTRDFELILVNDCSRDSSWQVICELCERLDWIRGINLMRNYGQHNALLCGIRSAVYDTIVTLDDDLQIRPVRFPVFCQCLMKVMTWSTVSLPSRDTACSAI